MKLAEVAAGVDAHLKRFEADPVINARRVGRTLAPYWQARAYDAGSRVGLIYVGFQGVSFITKTQALRYLEWLDAGNVGKHYKCPFSRHTQK